MKKEYIILNGEKYNADNIKELKETSVEWQRDIYSFLENWFDDTDSISVQTSGSTGAPKKIDLSKKVMRNSARLTNNFFELNALKTAFLCLPASYIAGKMMLVRALEGGYNLITTEPKANSFENLTEMIDFLAVTPYQLQHSIESLKMANIKNIIVGGSQINSELKKKIKRLSANVYETYGMTETASHIALRKINGKSASEYFTVLNGVSIRQDSNGCLIIRAPYITDNEIITNDVVEIPEKNKFRWLGRIDNVINSGGIKIFPEQIEQKIDDLIPYRYFISSLPDEILGNKVVLVVETTAFTESNEAILKEELQTRLSKYEIPKQMFYISKFICSSSDKILKNETLKEIRKPEMM